MTNFKEFLFISDDSETANTVQCYDIQLGVRVMTYKNGHGVAKRTLSFIGENYIVTAETSKPFLHVWSTNKEEPIKRMILSGKVTAMTISSNGIYSAAGIENKIYIWNVPTGQLLNVVSYHHEPITKIVFWDCCYIITCGADGLVAVWRLVDILTKETGDIFSAGQFRHIVPFFSSSQHSLPVTDMHLASCGITARLFTVSADQTCQIFSIGPDGGKFLLTITFDYILNSVIVDRLQRKLFVGTDCGLIVYYPLEPRHDTTIRHVDSSINENSLIGHNSSVNCLALSHEDNILASGSNDKQIILWNLSTHQQISVHQTFGIVTDLVFRVFSQEFLSTDLKVNYLISNFDRTVVSESENIEIKILVQNELISDEFDVITSENLNVRQFFGCSPAIIPENQLMNVDVEMINDFNGNDKGQEKENTDNMEDNENHGRNISSLEIEITKLRQQNKQLKNINKKLYMYALDQCWQNGHIKDKPKY